MSNILLSFSHQNKSGLFRTTQTLIAYKATSENNALSANLTYLNLPIYLKKPL